MELLEAHQAINQQWKDALAAGAGGTDDDPTPLGPVVRLYDESGTTVDLRSGLITTGFPRADEFRNFILSQLSPPREFME